MICTSRIDSVSRERVADVDILGLLGKFFGASWKIGAAFALLAVCVFGAHQYKIEPFAALDKSASLYQAIMVAGLLGATVVFIEIVKRAWEGIVWLGQRFQRKRQERKKSDERRERGLKNLAVAPVAHREALDYIKQKDMRRIYAARSNMVLHEMWQTDLLEADDPKSMNARHVHFVVPDHIWEAIQESSRPPPSKPPWEPSSTEWMRR